MRGFVWLSVATAALVTACVVGIEDVESKGGNANQGGAGSSGDASVGGSSGSGSGGNQTGGNGGSPTGGNGGAQTGGNGGTSAIGGNGGSVSGGTGGVNPCPTGMVAIPSGSSDYCIDAREVTQADYATFLAGVVPQQSDPCSSNAELEPNCDEYNPTAHPQRPVVCVDWCDARAYCLAQGKHLCGKIGGGSSDVGAYLDANTNEWFRACSAGGTQKFPYGNLYAAGKCNDISAPTTAPIDVGSFAECVGGYPDLYDMSGNVREWEASCNVNGCYARGGSYLDLQDNVACNAAILTVRTAATKEIGFRCCAD